MQDVTQQMGQLGLERRKKKDRHAYHQIEQTAPQTNWPPAHSASPQPGAPWPGTQQPWQSQQMPQAAPQPFSGHVGTPINMQQQQPAAGGPRVNPEQVPSIPLSRDTEAERYKTQMYATMQQRLPPPATTPFVAFDEGNASPKHARLTLNTIPMAQDQLQLTSLPLGLVLQPLAKQTEGEQPIPVLDFGDAGPPRCRRCRAYINPFMIFSNGGNRMTCNLCAHPNEVPPEYFAPTDQMGVRVDRAQRPELSLGTCEFLVPKEYWVHEPVPMRFLFLLEATVGAASRGFLHAMCDGILTALYGSGDGAEAESESKVPAGAQVGFMTYDRHVHFYNVSSSEPQQLIVSDLDEPFAAMSSEHLFVDPNEHRETIKKLLSSIPRMFASTPLHESSLLPSLRAAMSALEPSGGKIICSVASLPMGGPIEQRLQQRDKGNIQNDDGDAARELLRPEHQLYKKAQADMVKAGVGVDFFMASPSGGFLDIADIGYIAEKTGGECFYYSNWAHPRDCLRLEKEISHCVQREQGYAALMKVRCSNGLQVAHYSGCFTQHTFGADLELANISEDSAMSVTFSYDGKLDPKLDAHFQAAILYTTAAGKRRVRCINVVASIAEHARESMKFVDQDAVLCIMAKEAMAKVGERNLKDIRQGLQDKVVEIVADYRKHFSIGYPSTQLVLPENLKEIAMYTLGLLKSRALKAGREPSDRRIQEARMVKAMGSAELSLYMYPRMLAIHNLDPSEGFADENGQLKMPQAVRLTFADIEEGGVYLVDNGQILLLWIHQRVSPNLLEDLFGPEFTDIQALDPNMSSLPVLDTLLNAQVRNILLHLESQRGSKGLAIQLARQGLDGAEYDFARLLYEDRGRDAESYVDFLVQLHRRVSSEVSFLVYITCLHKAQKADSCR
ncbi:beta-sandwich domain of Sec23/24 [Piedraia hortae CBS 480.64]|uniref:Beta-sandwich domain of Sec23/24 n=1 Tax=Piedraia hortae CBS 480.64 TaxID=1314780 RepID=A0A6A7C8S4_9PEZI|nr:beta-sandwich domain of Sec23/24 [Piedraia hortae CBS 480.64]